jgi:glycosyltransferase involved in cell wall biosynthesis
MPKPTGAIAIASNSYNSPTGYGQQVKHLADSLLRNGYKVANLSNYGLQGRTEQLKTPHGYIDHYPTGLKPYSDDVMPVWFEQFTAQYPDLPSALITLYDVWVLNDLKFDGPIWSWVPLDHSTLPPEVFKFLARSNVTPITMSPHGQRQLEAAGLESTYIPHSIDTKVMKPTDNINGIPTRQFMDVPEDAFLVSIVAANKANGGFYHRKALAENLLAFSIFRKEHPDAYLYLHTEASNAYGGFIIPRLLKAVGLTEEHVRIADGKTLLTGYPSEALAALYTASDVLLSTSYGEGFGVPSIEAQACGTRIITSAFAASQDLAGEDSYLIPGQPFWDEKQLSFFEIPQIGAIVNGLKLAYDAPRGVSAASIEFASQFDNERVWRWYWEPFIRENLLGGTA